jgi:hypothetical protein
LGCLFSSARFRVKFGPRASTPSKQCFGTGGLSALFAHFSILIIFGTAISGNFPFQTHKPEGPETVERRHNNKIAILQKEQQDIRKTKSDSGYKTYFKKLKNLEFFFSHIEEHVLCVHVKFHIKRTIFVPCVKRQKKCLKK